MKFLDRLLQRWRIARAAQFIPAGARVLDVGCHAGELFQALAGRAGDGVGIDPLAPAGVPRPGIKLIRGRFPEDLPPGPPFDVVTALAVLEHVPRTGQSAFLRACHRALVTNGRLILTVPSPHVDTVLTVLMKLRLVHGMSFKEHYGFDPAATAGLARAAGFASVAHERFELGLNHLFVFRAGA